MSVALASMPAKKRPSNAESSVIWSPSPGLSTIVPAAALVAKGRGCYQSPFSCVIVTDGNGGRALTLVLSLVVVDVIAGGGLPIISDRRSVVRGSENTLTSSNFDFRSMHGGPACTKEDVWACINTGKYGRVCGQCICVRAGGRVYVRVGCV